MASPFPDQNNNSNSEDESESELVLMSPSNFANMNGEEEDEEGKDVFHKTIGALEDILMSPSFQNLYSSQLEHCYEIYNPDNESTESKADNFQLFKEYTQTMCQFMEPKLKEVIPEFEMEQFLSTLQQLILNDEISSDGDIIEVLLSLVDISKFDELMEDYRNVKEGNTIDLSPGITVTHIQ